MVRESVLSSYHAQFDLYFLITMNHKPRHAFHSLGSNRTVAIHPSQSLRNV